uniref:Uncharacterized protein n=1 Tax=Meloidogyne enterolobii TaxID=390850 RepID=A0A6V7VMU7_MELEN|nr:unnamed protein product [Meloidogyne enterolobii]
MASVWSWNDLLKGFCSCSNSTTAQTSEPISKVKETEKQHNNSNKTILSTTTSLNSDINNIWGMDQSWCSSTLGRNTTTTTAPSPTCHFNNNINGPTSLSLSASFASPVPPSFRPFRHREMKRRRVTNGDFLGLLERMQSQRMDEQRCYLPFNNNKNGSGSGGGFKLHKRNTTTTTAPSPTCHFNNNINGPTSLSLSASFASPVPPSFRPFRHREMKRRRVTNGDFLGLLERMQSQRMDEQRCYLPFNNNKNGSGSGGGFKTPNGAQNGKAQLTATSSVCSSHNNLQRLSSRENGGALVKQILSKPGPYPQIVVVTKGEECGFWLDGAIELEDIENSDSFIYNNVANVESKLETDDEGALSYRRHFLGREHHNFYALDPLLGPLILSVRVESSSSTQTPSSPKSTPNQQQQQNYRLILRSRIGTKHQLIPSTSFNNSRPSASQLARHLYADIGTDRFWPVAFPGGSELILQFDEHVISNTYKFGGAI